MDQRGNGLVSRSDIRRKSKPPDFANQEPDLSETLRRMSLGTATAIPLPASSPAGTPERTPKDLRNTVLYTDHHAPSPARRPSVSSPLNPERRSSTPLLHMKRSSSSLHKVEPPLRRISSYRYPSPSTSTSPGLPNFEIPNQAESKPAITASSIAQDHFKKELDLHGSGNLPSEAVVVLHDSCYGHRYSRPRTSKAQLNTIVERPERIHASILGLSTAYIRLGERHAGGKCPIRPKMDLRDMPQPPFQIRKTNRTVSLSSSAVTQVHGQQWMEELKIMCESAEGKLAMNGKELVRPLGYGRQEDGSLSPQLHDGDLYLCRDSLDALEGCLGGICEGVDAVFGPGATKRAFVCIRPPGHHCSSSYPSGFCWLNNVHVGIAHAAMTHGLTHAAIIDFDLHHGDGSQAITWNHNKRASTLPKNAPHHKKVPIGYYSIHDINSYPCEMGDEEKVKNASLCIENAHGQSIWNVHLEAWKNHTEFWRLYRDQYLVLLEKARKFLRTNSAKSMSSLNGPRPKAAIFISAGFDASEWEGQGMQRHKVNVPTDFYAKFSSDIMSLAEEDGLAVDGRVISVLEGGYSDRALTSGVLSHVCGMAQRTGPLEPNGMPLMSGLAVDLNNNNRPHRSAESQVPKNELNGSSVIPYDAAWWELQNLEALERMVHPPQQPAPSKKPKDKAPGNYSSPTQSSTAKMIDPSMARRYSSLSAVDISRLSSEPEPPQPLPDVDWVTASFELSRLLIPSDRQTLSCRHDELNAETNKARRDRQSAIGIVSKEQPAEGRMQLRERKTRPTMINEEPSRTSSKADRRRTIAAANDLPDPTMQTSSAPSESDAAISRPVSRRLSAASSVLSSFSNMTLEDRPGYERQKSSRPAPAERSSRAPSVMSERPHKVPLVKKSRVPNSSKPPAARTGRASPKKVAAGSAQARVPSGPLKPKSGDESTVKNDVVKSDQTLASSAGGAKTNDADELSTGVRKIKLKVPTPEENAAREKKVKDPKQVKEKKVKAPRKVSAPKGVAQDEPMMTELGRIVTPASAESTASGMMAPARLMNDVENANVAAKQAGLTHSGKLATTEEVPERSIPYDFVPQGTNVLTAQAPSQEAMTAPTSVLPLEMASQETSGCTLPPAPTSTLTRESMQNVTTPLTETQHQALPVVQGLQNEVPMDAKQTFPNYASPPGSCKKTRADLPRFTATSPIPFAQPSNAKRDTLLQNGNQVPDENRSFARVENDAATDQPTDLRHVSNGSSIGHRQHLESSRPSIWDVPETPRQ